MPCIELGDGRLGAGLECVTKGKQPQHLRLRALLDQPGQGAAFGFPGAGRCGKRAWGQPGFFQQATVPQRQTAALQGAGNATAGQRLAVGNVRHVEVTRRAGIQHGLGQRVFAAALQGAGRLQQMRFITVQRTEVSDLRSTGGQGAGFVENHGADFMGALQRFGVLDQDSVTGGNAGAGHDRGGCRQAQGTRASDHQYGHGVDQCGFDRRAIQPPAQQRGQGNQQHHGHEHLTDLVHQLLDRCFGRLRVFHQADDARQYGFCPQRQGLDHQPAFTIDGTASNLIPRLFRYRQAFTADQGLVGMALALDHFAIDREAFTGFDQHQVIEA